MSSVALVAELRERIQQLQSPGLDLPALPTEPTLASLLPSGALRVGATYSVENSLTLIMLLLSAPSAAGAWCGIVGIPEFGVEAAAEFGVDLERLILVPTPGDQWLAATAALADALSLIVVRPPKRASEASIARLSARLRKRSSTLIVLGSWPQSEAMLSLTESNWSGIGRGRGRLRERDLTVTVTSRAWPRPRSARVHL